MDRRSKKPPAAPASDGPHDALADLMDGVTPKQEALRFPNENPASSNGFFGQSGQSGRSRGKMEEYDGDYHYPSSAGSGEYRPNNQRSTYDSVRDGAAKSGTYMKEKTSAGVTALKQKDWSKEKELAGKAGAATKSAAITVGSAAKTGGSWLFQKSKSGIESIKGKNAK